MIYKNYIVEYVPTGNTHIDHKDDICCRVYLRLPGDTTEPELLSSFLILGGEVHDYGSAEAAITAYMRRNYPDNDEQDIRDYRQLEECRRELQQRMKRPKPNFKIV